MKLTPLQTVIKHYGSQRALARAMNVTEGAVSHWVKDGYVPAGSAARIERAMRGRVKTVHLVKQ